MANPAISFVIGATLAGAFNATIGQATGQFQRLGQAMASLQGQADKIAAFRQASSDLDQAKIAWADARQKLAGLKKEMDGVLEPSRALQGAFFKAQRAADIAKQAFVEKGQATRATRAALDQAGVSVKNLANEEKRLGARQGLAATAIAGAARLIYEYWEPLKSFFGGLWKGISGVFGRVSGRIEAAFAPVARLVGSLFAPLPPLHPPPDSPLRAKAMCNFARHLQRRARKPRQRRSRSPSPSTPPQAWMRGPSRSR